MFYFKFIPSCSFCEYANLYIPYFSYPHSDPFCCKGHGKCEVDKFCEDFKLINVYSCYECKFIEFDDGKEYCSKKMEYVNKNNESCAYFENMR